MKRVSLTIAVALLCGCASDINVLSDKGDKLPGVPIHSPILAEVSMRTTYSVRSGKEHEEFAKFCSEQQTLKVSTAVLPLGRVRYVDFEPASLGKSEFSLEFTDNGVVKKVTVNSDATAGVDSVTGFLEKVLPFYKEPAAAPAETTVTTQALDFKDDPEKLRKAHCVEKETRVEGAREVEIKLLRAPEQVSLLPEIADGQHIVGLLTD